MPRPNLEPHLRRTLIDEHTIIGALFSVDGKENNWFCSLYAPGDSIIVVLEHDSLYAYAEGPTPEDAVFEARKKLWKGL